MLGPGSGAPAGSWGRARAKSYIRTSARSSWHLRVRNVVWCVGNDGGTHGLAKVSLRRLTMDTLKERKDFGDFSLLSVALLCIALHWFDLLCMCSVWLYLTMFRFAFALLCIGLFSNVLHCFALCCFVLHCLALHCFALLCFALHSFALFCFALLCIVLPFIALLYIALLCLRERRYCNRLSLHIIAKTTQFGRAKHENIWKCWETSSTPEIVEIYENPTCLRKP